MASKKRHKLEVDWNRIDWSLRNIEIPWELEVSRELDRQHRLKLFPSFTGRKQQRLVLESTVMRTAEKYGVTCFEARQWHLEAGLNVVRGRPKLVLPADYVPGSLSADAERLGVGVSTLWTALKRQAIAVNRDGKKQGPDSRNCAAVH